MDRVTRRLSDMELHVSRDPISEARARWVRAVRSADRERGYARLAIPGGSAAAVVRHTRIILGDVWRRSRLTYTDERCVPFDAQDSNRGSLHRDGTFIPTDPPAVELSLFQTGEAPDEAVRRVAAALGRDFDAGLDVLLLGMGPEGHIASLFPQRDPHEGLVAHIEDSPRPPPHRITLTLKILSTARHAILLAMGEGKRHALSRVIAGDTTLPATALRRLAIYTDQDIRH